MEHPLLCRSDLDRFSILAISRSAHMLGRMYFIESSGFRHGRLIKIKKRQQFRFMIKQHLKAIKVDEAGWFKNVNARERELTAI
jgi:hypothetical protein